MALLKLCKQWYGDKSKDIYLLQGTAARDAEDAPVGGKDHAKVSIAAVQNQDGTTVWVNLNGWRDRAADILNIRKGDSVFAIGAFSQREYNGKAYYDMDADFLSISGTGIVATPRYEAEAPELPPMEFPTLTDEDEKIPF